MFICCNKQLKLLKNSSTNSEIFYDSVCCICDICKEKFICKFLCKECCENLEKSNFHKCENIFSQPLKLALHNRNIDKSIDLLINKYDLYKSLNKKIMEYIFLYKNFYKIFKEIYTLNNYDLNKTKKCFTTFFSLGVLYFIKDKKKFICKKCLYE